MTKAYRKCNPCALFLIFFIGLIILVSLFTYPNLPNLSIEDFSIPAFKKTSNQTDGDIYFHLKLKNMNKAIGLYYNDPISLAFSYYPLDEPYQKYVWECTLPPFYQGNGKTKHIKTLIGLPSPVVQEKYDRKQKPLKLVKFTVNVIVSYRFKQFWKIKKYNEVLEVSGDVEVNANTGERVSKGSIKLVDTGDIEVVGATDVVSDVIDILADVEPDEKDSKRRNKLNKSDATKGAPIVFIFLLAIFHLMSI